MTLIIFILILNGLILVQCDWSLIWNDEFDQDRMNLDSKKWDIEDTGNRCEEPFSSQLNCMTSREQNVRTVSGALAITAIHQDNTTNSYKKPFTSAYIYSSEYFQFGKFEVRAALPMGKLLRAQINLYEPEQQDNSWVGIALVDFKQITGLFDVGVWETPGNFSNYNSFKPRGNLSDFHVYAVERAEGVLRWYFDGYNYYNYRISHLDSRLKDRLSGQMEVDINLVVGGPKMNGTLTNEDVQDWQCPSLIVDYVRVYQYSNEFNRLNEGLKNSENTPDHICNQVQNLNKLNNTGNSPKSRESSFMFVYYLVPVIVTLAIIIVMLTWKLKQHRKQIKRLGEHGDMKFDSDKPENFYNIIDENYGKFADETYETVDDNYQDTYLDVYDDSKSDLKINEESNYLEMKEPPSSTSNRISNEYL